MRCSSKPLVSLLALALVVPALAQRLTVSGYFNFHLPSSSTDDDLVQVVADGSEAAVLHADGRVNRWYWSGGVIPFGQPATKIAMFDVSGPSRRGWYRVYALLKDGTIRTNSVILTENDGPPIGGLSNVKDLFSGPGTGVLALKGDGTLVLLDSNDPIVAPPTGLRDVVQADLCIDNGIALRKDGTVVVWGANGNKQFQVPHGLRDVVQVAAGYHAFMALKKDGSIVQWGAPYFRYEYATAVFNAAPAGLPPVKRVSMSPVGAYAVLTDGRTVTWGTVGAKAGDSLPVGLLATRAVVATSGESSKMTTFILSGVNLTLERPRLHVYGSTTARVALPFKAPAGGSVVALTSSDPSVSIPASVIVPEGKSDATFSIGSLAAKPPAGAVTLTASVAGQTDSVPLTVYGKVPDVDVDAEEVVGGSAQVATATYYVDALYGAARRVTLTAPAAVTPSVVALLAANARSSSVRLTFKPTTVPIQTGVSVGGVASAPFRVVPLTARLEVNRWAPYAGQKPELFLSLNAPLPAPRLATLASTDAKALGMPSDVMVPAGVTALPIDATSTPVGDDRSVLLTSALLGWVGEERLTARGIAPAISFTPSLIGGGATTPVTLAIPEPLDVPFTLGLTSDVPNVASVPSSLVFAPGLTSTTFPVTTSPTDAVVPANISATFDGRTSGGTLTVAPAIKLSFDAIAETIFGTTTARYYYYPEFAVPYTLRVAGAPLLDSPLEVRNSLNPTMISYDYARTLKAGMSAYASSTVVNDRYRGTNVLKDTLMTVTATDPLALAPATTSVLIKADPLQAVSLRSVTVVGGSTPLVYFSNGRGTGQRPGPSTTATATLKLYALASTPVTVTCSDPDVTITGSDSLVAKSPSVAGPVYYQPPSSGSTGWPYYDYPTPQPYYIMSGSVTFGVATKKVTATKTVTITVTAGGVTKTLALTITP